MIGEAGGYRRGELILLRGEQRCQPAGVKTCAALLLTKRARTTGPNMPSRDLLLPSPIPANLPTDCVSASCV